MEIVKKEVFIWIGLKKGLYLQRPIRTIALQYFGIETIYIKRRY